MEAKAIIDELKAKIPKSKGIFLILFGIVGLLLILLSSFDRDKNASASADSSVPTAAVSADYTERTEIKLKSIISDMLGSSKVTVMVTLESGSEYVYADEVKTDAELTKDQTRLKTQQNDSNQKTYVIVKDSDGNEKPLIVTEKMPVVRGVVVVCEGGSETAVAAAVRKAVSSALGIDENKICVIGRHS